MDTICALASARGRAGVAVVRLSGPNAHDAIVALTGPLPPLRQAGLRQALYDGEVLDQALVIGFAEGASFTGEAVAEVHLHGSQAVVAAVLRALCAFPGVRLAEAGEFTRRALENGCLDLAQVEGLADLIDAETDAQRRQAVRVLSGAVGKRASNWRGRLIRAAALLEATIDFADEDVPVDVVPEVTDLLDGLLFELRHEVAGTQAAERVRDGFEVAIVGAPNVGKSTLLNTLAGREAAITSSIAGTTRDVIEVRMDLNGLAVTLLDTAGLREASDEVEKIGIERSLKRAADADLRVFVLTDQDAPPMPVSDGDIVVRGKADLSARPGMAISGKTGQGVDRLLEMIGDQLNQRASSAGLLVRERQRQAVLGAIGAMESAREEVRRATIRAELAAAHLLHATRALDMLVGRVDVENLLDEIFASFCIGK